MIEAVDPELPGSPPSMRPLNSCRPDSLRFADLFADNAQGELAVVIAHGADMCIADNRIRPEKYIVVEFEIIDFLGFADELCVPPK